MAFKSYTSCVQPQDYQNPPASELEVGLADIVLLLTGGFTVLGPVAIFELETLLEYLLNGKLICLDGDQCAVGQVIGYETPSSKSFPNDIDNDFSINLMLSPNQISDFIGLTLDQAYQLVQAHNNIQGNLIKEQPGMPLPYGADGDKHYVPYPLDPPVDVTLANQLGGGGAFFPFQTPIYVPVLHLECEGSRIHDLLAVLQGIGGLGTGICDFEVLGIPIGKVICTIIATILAPITVAALIVAWFNAQDGNADDPRTGGLPGQLEPGNMIVVTGRWVYDAGHQGWNELHPVKSIQKIAESIVGFEANGDPKEIIGRWCTLVSQVPPPNRDGPGGEPSTMTPGQQVIWDNQLQPENRWILHPLIDGCLPPDQPPPTNIK